MLSAFFIYFSVILIYFVLNQAKIAFCLMPQLRFAHRSTYAMVKNAKEVDADAVKRFLNDELTRILFDHEAHGLARNTVYVEGVEYPALVVTTVKDTGSYLEISIAVTSTSVKRLLDFRHAATLNQQGKTANADDEQFI